jgi:hypothetical protein
MPPKVAALPSELIQHALREAGLSGQDICAILRAPEWHGLNSQDEQILFLFDFVGSNCGIGLSNQVFARTFGIPPHHVLKVRSKARKPQKGHRALRLDKAQEKSVLQFVQDGFTSGKYVTQKEILSFVEEHFQKTVTYGWLTSFLERWVGIIIRTTVMPQEQLRLRIPREYLNDYISLIKEYVPLVPAELIFN